MRPGVSGTTIFGDPDFQEMLRERLTHSIKRRSGDVIVSLMDEMPTDIDVFDRDQILRISTLHGYFMDIMADLEDEWLKAKRSRELVQRVLHGAARGVDELHSVAYWEFAPEDMERQIFSCADVLLGPVGESGQRSGGQLPDGMPLHFPEQVTKAGSDKTAEAMAAVHPAHLWAKNQDMVTERRFFRFKQVCDHILLYLDTIKTAQDEYRRRLEGTKVPWGGEGEVAPVLSRSRTQSTELPMRPIDPVSIHKGVTHAAVKAKNAGWGKRNKKTKTTKTKENA